MGKYRNDSQGYGEDCGENSYPLANGVGRMSTFVMNFEFSHCSRSGLRLPALDVVV